MSGSTRREAQLEQFIEEALAADREIDRGGEVYAAADVHAWLTQLVRRERAPWPKPRRGYPSPDGAGEVCCGSVATAGIVIIGDEILSGKFADENAVFLIGELRSLGVELRRVTIIPDELEDIAATVASFSGRFDHVFTSGGVGPTHDDLTMEGIARGFGTRVVRQPELEQRVRSYWGEKLAEPNLRLADVPEGAELVYGRDHVWPVVAYRNVYILPGVPALFRRKFVDIRDRFRSEPVTVARVYVDADEGQIADDLDAVVAAHPAVKVGSYPRFSEQDFRVMITFESRAGDEVAAAQAMLVARLGAKVVRHDEPALAGG